MKALLEAVVRRDPSWAYPRRLLDALSPVSDGRAAAARGTRASPTRSADRELEVLRLLATDLPGPEISRQLYISLNTLRTHTKNLYAKLGVNSRRAAVSRARELHLL